MSILLAKSQLVLHPALSNKVILIVSKFAQQLPELHFKHSIYSEQYLWLNLTLDRLQHYAYTKGFAVVTLGGSEQKGRI